MRAAIIALLALGCGAAPAKPVQREPKTPELAATWRQAADNWNDIGDAHYRLALFERAIEAFKRAYQAEHEADPESPRGPLYLYKIAEAYRQSSKCHDAAFFYKRFLSLAERTKYPVEDEQRREVEDRIRELGECSRSQPYRKPPDDVIGDKA